MPTSTLGHSPVRPLPPPSGGNPIDNIPTAEQLLDAWRLFKQHSPPYLARTSPGDIVLFVQQLDELRALCCAAHPDACQVCREAIVPEDERICKCAGRTCLSCAGKAGVCCPHCRSSDVLPLIAIDKVPLTFSALMRSDFKGIKPELVALQEDARARLEQEEADELMEGENDDDDGDGGDFVAAQAQELARIERANRRRRRDAQPEQPPPEEQPKEQPATEDQPKEQDEPRAKRQRSDEQQKKQKEDKARIQISTMLHFCAQHGDQRTFKELFVALNDARQWNQRQMGNLASADTMNADTIREQWFLTANMSGLGKEMRILCNLRLGEFYERLDHLAGESKLVGVDDKGNAQHYTTALDYARRALGYDKKHEKHLRACQQFFAVWKEWHPIIAIAQSEVSWSTLLEMLTKNKLLEAVRAWKADPIESTPAPLPYAIPPRWRGQYRRPDNVAPPSSLFFSEQEIQPVLLDSYVIPQGLQKLGFDPDVLLGILREKPGFVPRANNEMRYRGNELARDKFFAVRSDEVNEHGMPLVLRKYGYPGFQYASMLHYHAFRKVPGVHGIADKLQQHIYFNKKQPILNHAIGTLYTREADEIGFHHDKMDDITPGTPIISVSFGDQREFHFCKPGNETGVPDFIQVLQAGDIFILGPRTNSLMKHAIAPIAKERQIKRDTGVFSDRMSLVLRNIATTITRAELLQRIGDARAPPDEPVVEPVPAPRLVGVELNPGPTALTRVTRESGFPFVFFWWPSEPDAMDHEAREQLKSRFRVSGIISLKHIFFCEERLGSSALLDAGDLPRSCLRGGRWGRWPLSQEREVHAVLHKARAMHQEKQQRERKRLMLMELRQRELQRLRREQIHLVLFLMVHGRMRLRNRAQRFMMRAYRAVPAPRLVGVELNPGPPLSSLLSVVKFQEPPAEFIAECRKEMAQSNPDALSEYLIRLVFTTGMLQQSYNQGVHAFNEQNQQLTAARAAMNTLPDPRVVDTKADAAALQAETEAWRNKKRDDFDKHHLVARQLLERRLHDFALSHKAAHQSSVIVHALDAIANEVQTREAAKVRSKAMMAQACQQADQAQQLRQQARALMSSAAAAPPAAIGLLK